MQPCDPDKSFGLLVSDIGRLLRRLFDERIREKVGISSTQWGVLQQLRREDRLTQSRLAELVEIEQSSLVRHLDHLEQMDLIKRIPDTNDRRINHIHLSKKAGPFFEQALGVIFKLREELLQDINDTDLQTTITCLGLVKARAQTMHDNKESFST